MEDTGENGNVTAVNAAELSEINEENTLKDENGVENKCPKSCEKEEEFANTKVELNSSFEEVFRDPRTFDFLLKIGKSNPLRDLRKESLYVKFDPYVPPSDLSTQESGLAKSNILSNITELVESSKDTNSAKNEDEVSHALCKIEENNIKYESIIPEEICNSSLVIPTTDATLTSPLFSPGRKLYVQKINELKEILNDLRNQIVKRELEQRERRNYLNTVLQQEKMKHTRWKLESSPIRIIVKEYEDCIKSLTIEKTKSENYFEEMKKKLQDDLVLAIKQKSYTEKACDQMVKDYDDIENKTKMLLEEKLELEEQIEKYGHLFNEQEQNIQAKSWEVNSKKESIKIQINSALHKQKLELSLIENQKKALELKEAALKQQLERMTNDNKSIVGLINGLMTSESCL